MFYSMVHKCIMTQVFNILAQVFNILATNRSCGNIDCSYQHHQPSKKTLQVSVLMIEYLVAVLYEL